MTALRGISPDVSRCRRQQKKSERLIAHSTAKERETRVNRRPGALRPRSHPRAAARVSDDDPASRDLGQRTGPRRRTGTTPHLGRRTGTVRAADSEPAPGGEPAPHAPQTTNRPRSGLTRRIGAAAAPGDGPVSWMSRVSPDHRPRPPRGPPPRPCPCRCPCLCRWCRMPCLAHAGRPTSRSLFRQAPGPCRPNPRPPCHPASGPRRPNSRSSPRPNLHLSPRSPAGPRRPTPYRPNPDSSGRPDSRSLERPNPHPSPRPPGPFSPYRLNAGSSGRPWSQSSPLSASESGRQKPRSLWRPNARPSPRPAPGSRRQNPRFPWRPHPGSRRPASLALCRPPSECLGRPDPQFPLRSMVVSERSAVRPPLPQFLVVQPPACFGVECVWRLAPQPAPRSCPDFGCWTAPRAATPMSTTTTPARTMLTWAHPRLLIIRGGCRL